MHFSLVRISTPHVPNTRAFDDVLLPLWYAFRRLGYEAEIRVDSFHPEARNICLGANYDPDQQWHRLPAGTIIFNLEQLEAGGYPWLKDTRYLDLMREYEVWDFSRRNLDFLAGRGIQGHFLPLGYVPEMTRLAPCPAPTHDALFYGAMTPRRRQVLEELTGRGLTVNVLTRAYGQARDHALYAARLLLNIHHSLPASLEIVRLGYALANRRAVVSELAPDTYHYPELREACAFGEYEALAPIALELAADERRREERARRGFEAFAALRLDEALERLVDRRTGPGRGAEFESLPDQLRVGAGPDFRNEALNIEGDPRFRPDLVLDLSRPLNFEEPHVTARFGDLSLRPGSFRIITCPGLLARTPDPDQLMANLLALLQPDGRLILTLPYDLSEEAAGLPRSFNEPALTRYTGRAGLLGWTEARFAVETVDYRLSAHGRALAARGRSLDELRRTPRAVAGLRVVLRKCPYPPAERTEDQALTRDFYLGPAVVWQVAEPGAAEADAAPEPAPPALWRLWLRLAALGLRRERYRLNLRFKLAQGHDRYPEKLAELEKEMGALRRLLKP